MAVRAVLVTLAMTFLSANGAGHEDHGGVKMGVINVHCDDAKTGIETDWDPSSTAEYTCDGPTLTHSKKLVFKKTCEKETKRPIHVCYPAALNYTEFPPTSGRHRPNWAVYGEYEYLPIQRWLHNMEHGAIVMLYHPCADPAEVQKLREILTGCVRRHIITPSKLLPTETPFALLAWGCKLMMNTLPDQAVQMFIKQRFRQSPEGNVLGDGKYNISLIHQAAIVTDKNDTTVCPAKTTSDETPSPSASSAQAPSLYDLTSAIEEASRRRREKLNAEAAVASQKVRRLMETYKRLTDSLLLRGEPMGLPV